MSRHYTARMLFRDFREARPEFWRPGAYYRLVDVMTIMISSPGIGKFTYTPTGNQIRWIEKWTDPKYIKQMEKEKRPEDYARFIKTLKEFMDMKGITQESISLVTGVSRQSINAYLAGRKIPKTSTMKKMCEKLGIDF